MHDDANLNYLWILGPLAGSWLLSLFIGKVDSKSIIKPWFALPEWSYFGVWTILYIILGVILYKSADEGDDLLFWLTLIFTLVTYLWVYTYVLGRSPIHSLYLLIILLVFSFIIYTEMFYSNMVSDDDPDSFGKGYIFMFIPVMLWILFTLITDTHTKYVDILKSK